MSSPVDKIITSLPSPPVMLLVPPVRVIVSLPDPPVIVSSPVPLVMVKLAEEFRPFIVVIEFASVPCIPNVPDPVKFRVLSAFPEFSRTIKLVLVLLTFAVATPVPAISINKLVFVLEDPGPISSNVKSVSYTHLTLPTKRIV